MSELTLSYSGFSGDLKIKTMHRDGEVLFSLPDVVQILAKENSAFNEQGKTQGFKGLLKASMEALEEDEKYLAHSDSGDHDFFVTEPGLYRVVSRDLSPASKKFQRWIFHEVLPSIRRHGFYPPPSQSGESELKVLANLLQSNVSLLVKEIEKREALEKQVHEQFENYDNRINKLEKIIANEDGYMTIQNRLNDLDMNMRIELIWAWCEKIRFQESYPCLKSSNRFETKYPISLIDQAIGNLNHFINS
ncbi:MAG: BRO family protein [Methylovulum sp.]|nr:BRO family protein [Methylovulum sp.]